MAGLTATQSIHNTKRTERLFKKHMVEKRRRNRINGSLEQLKMLVLSGLNKDPEQYEKIEKADILDMTVHYLKVLTASSGRGQHVPVQPVSFTARPLTVNTQYQREQQHSQCAGQGLLQIAVRDAPQRAQSLSPYGSSWSPQSSLQSSPQSSPQASPQPTKYYSKKFQRYVDSDTDSDSNMSPVSKLHGSDVWRPW